MLKHRTNYRVIYGDTDSVFVWIHEASDHARAEAAGNLGHQGQAHSSFTALTAFRQALSGPDQKADCPGVSSTSTSSCSIVSALALRSSRASRPPRYSAIFSAVVLGMGRTTTSESGNT